MTMASYYSVIRFVPSALAEEFVNVGVLTFGDGDDRVRGKFLEDWHRVERFAEVTSSVRQARAFQEWVLESMVPEGPSDQRLKRIDVETVRRLANEWAGSLQLTQPRGSLLDPDELLEDVAPTFLIEPPERAERMPDKRHVVKLTSRSLQGSIKRRFGKKDHVIVQTRHPLSAGVRPRLFDIVIANGSPRHAVQCFNFNVSDTKKLLEQIDAIAFAVEDVHRKLKGLPISAVAAPPEQDSDGSFAQAQATFKQVGVEVVAEDDVDAWSERVVESLARSA
jgi:hypothetical protein